jgi:hypothetical protein
MTDVAYIMGHGYSGSTLLTFLLAAHPEIATRNTSAPATPRFGIANSGSASGAA